ncbi:beta-carotene ketolase [Aurantiacibacter gangjinensis]|uniref:Beta-carotene ketolase n=1 Tax=Aurantiacibacter gangjinensis TaxID=502682 RepID=A0A0G9MT59_9SPHN|nr:beta-carotene ketolase [Aurantiacibacter gangjinensis]
MIRAAPLPRAKGTQTAIGLTLAALIAGLWLAVHVWAIFIYEISWSNWPVALAVAALQCWLSVGVFIVCHDAMHGSLAPGRPTLNSAIGGVLLFLYAGFAWRKMRAAHYDHHRHAGTRGDPDFDADNPRSAARWYGTFFRRYFGWPSILFVSSVVTVYWLLVGVPMVQIVLVYGLPAIASSLQLFYFGTYRPHRQEDAAFADRHNARSNAYPAWLSLATCFHFGYHLEHHRHPDVPWWQLPAKRRQEMISETTA